MALIHSARGHLMRREEREREKRINTASEEDAKRGAPRAPRPFSGARAFSGARPLPFAGGLDRSSLRPCLPLSLPSFLPGAKTALRTSKPRSRSLVVRWRARRVARGPFRPDRHFNGDEIHLVGCKLCPLSVSASRDRCMRVRCTFLASAKCAAMDMFTAFVHRRSWSWDFELSKCRARNVEGGSMNEEGSRSSYCFSSYLPVILLGHLMSPTAFSLCVSLSCSFRTFTRSLDPGRDWTLAQSDYDE